MLHDMAVPPKSVGAGGDETDDGGSIVGRFLAGLPHPVSDCGTVGRIHEHDFVGPAPSKPIILAGVVLRALGIFMSAARIERESEFTVESVEKPLRRRPFISGTAEMNISFHDRSAALGLKGLHIALNIRLEEFLRAADLDGTR